MKYRAIEKLNNEEKEFKGNNTAGAILPDIVKTIKCFCENEKFAEAVVNQEKTICECCESIAKEISDMMNNLRTKNGGGMQGIGVHKVSDIEVYKKAVEFYLPGADIKFSMDIVLPDTANKSDKIIKLSLGNFI